MKNDNLKTALLNAMEADAKRLDTAPENEKPHEFSPEFESAINRIIRRKKPLRLKVAVISAAAAAAILATTGVAAANGWNLKTAISGLFAEDKNDGSAFFGYDINGIGSKELDLTFERDGYTINVFGVAADKRTAFVLYDIVVENGYVFKNDRVEHTYSTSDSAYLTAWQNTENYFKMIDDELEMNRLPNGNYDFEAFNPVEMNSTNTDILLEQDGNVYHCAYRFDIKPLSLSGKNLIFDFNGITIVPESGNYYFVQTDVCDTVTIDFDFINDSDSVMLEPGEPFTFEGETLTLEAVELTPFSVYLRVSKPSDNVEDDIQEFDLYTIKIRDSVTLTMADGSTTTDDVLFGNKYDAGNATNEKTAISTNIHLMWKHPVNVDEIKSITIGDTTFVLD